MKFLPKGKNRLHTGIIICNDWWFTELALIKQGLSKLVLEPILIIRTQMKSTLKLTASVKYSEKSTIFDFKNLLENIFFF